MTKNIVLFNNKGGVGKTTFNFHLGYALESLGKKILFVDLDPQCNLSACICGNDRIENMWKTQCSIYHAILPLIKGTGDISEVTPYQVDGKNISLIVGDIQLSEFEGYLSQSWIDSLSGMERGFRITSAIYRIIKKLSDSNEYDYVLMDIGPNLGSLNRAVLLSCDYFFVPLIPDMFSLRGLENIGITFTKWIKEWSDAKTRFQNSKSLTFALQNGMPIFAGYINQQFNIYGGVETQSWEYWTKKITPTIDNKLVTVLKNIDPKLVIDLNNGSHKLGDFKNYHSLIPKSQKTLLPIFELKFPDVRGAHITKAQECGKDFKKLASKIIKHI